MKTVEIVCPDCKNKIKISANSAIISHYFNGRIAVTDTCSCCGNKIAIPQTTETFNLLKGRLENCDYNHEVPYNCITDAYLDGIQN